MVTRQDSVDLEHLLKLRVVVARIGEMDLARWWNTAGQLGPYGAAALRRGLPRTHNFAQARSVAAVAAHRCDEVFSLASAVSLWRLPADIEERFDARWEHWLDNAGDWSTFFGGVAAVSTPDLVEALRAFDLVSDSSVATVRSLEAGPGGRSLPLPCLFNRTREDLELLALGFSRGGVGTLTVPYARVGDR
jgi:hypothetical protein